MFRENRGVFICGTCIERTEEYLYVVLVLFMVSGVWSKYVGEYSHPDKPD